MFETPYYCARLPHHRAIVSQLIIVLLYLLNYFSVVILLIGVAISELVAHLVNNAVGIAKVASAKLLSSVACWSIMVFPFMVALVQLGVAVSLN